MSLSNDLISQFVKVVVGDKKTKTETTTYGTVVEYDEVPYVRLDGAEEGRLTPMSSTADVKEGDRVIVMVKNHTAVITGNVSDPSATTGNVTGVANSVTVVSGDVNKLSDKINEFDNVVADKVDTDMLSAVKADIESLKTDKLNVSDAEIKYATIEVLEATSAEVESLKTGKLSADEAALKYATIEVLEAAKADISSLQVDKLSVQEANATFADIEQLEAAQAEIEDLKVVKLSVGEADLKYANIDFSNIDNAAIEYFYSKSGLIENVVVADGTITGTLVGVTIKGDIIEGNTVVADKLVIQGEDGLYYKLNTDGVTTSAEQTEYNSLNGSIITAKSITATQISVDDLVAFDATIGGFTMTEDSIYSEVKDSEGNTTRGIYMDTDGQINFGDETNFIKYYKDEDGTYKLVISAASILYALNGKQYSIADLGQLGEYVHIGTYEDEPCIELGENDSDFKLIITNTRIMFKEGTSVPAYINNQSLHITKAVIEEEIQQGEFVWKVRENGNMGLMWKGASD